MRYAIIAHIARNLGTDKPWKSYGLLVHPFAAYYNIIAVIGRLPARRTLAKIAFVHEILLKVLESLLISKYYPNHN